MTDELQHSLNVLAGTTGLDAQGAANVWCGYAGAGKLDLVAALNSKAQTRGLELAGVLNRLAGTSGLEVNAAAAAIVAAAASGHEPWSLYKSVTWADLLDNTWGSL